jgi:hypothetical protein
LLAADRRSEKIAQRLGGSVGGLLIELQMMSEILDGLAKGRAVEGMIGAGIDITNSAKTRDAGILPLLSMRPGKA